MGIVDEDIERVRAAVPLVEVVQQYVPLRRVGTRWVGLCPFHAEKSPSFGVNESLGIFKCFGCNAGGDVISFVRELEHLDFVGAVELLANRAGIQLRYTSGGEGRDRQRRTVLVEAMAKAADWYHRRLLESPDARPARDYLRSRGIGGDVARRYQLGWAPDDWDGLVRGLGLPDDVARDTGLAFVNRRQRLQDSFRARVMFPIFNEAGDPVAFGGRVLPRSEDPAKYKNSPETRHLREVQDALWAQLGQDRRRGDRPGRDLRGLHRRHRLPPSGRAPRRRHVRYGPHRGARAPLEALRPPGRAGLRRRRGRPGRGGPLLRVGEEVRDRGERGPHAGREGPGAAGPGGSRRAGGGGRRRRAVPPFPARSGVPARLAGVARAQGQAGRGRPRGRARAP